MSAFIVSREHIDALVSVAISGPRECEHWHRPFSFYAHDGETLADWQEALRVVDFTTADEIGRTVWNENAVSVRTRYPDLYSGGEYPGADADFDASTPHEYTFSNVAPMHRPSAVEALKLIDCYEYQSCEHPGWRESAARRFCDALRGALITALPGYAEAPWEWADRRVSA